MGHHIVSGVSIYGYTTQPHHHTAERMIKERVLSHPPSIEPEYKCTEEEDEKVPIARMRCGNRDILFHVSWNFVRNTPPNYKEYDP